MDQIVKTITERLLRKLNPELPFYTPENMLEAGFPAFVVERIRLELETNLADSIVPPETDWAVMDAEEVISAWEQFLDATHNQLRLPSSYARGVIESSVADILDILVEPRKNLPDLLFFSSEDLYPDELEERMRWAVVYRHFVGFLPRYLKTRGLDKLSKERYATAVAQIDQKLSQRYSPLNWAQLLEPLFTLCNEEIEPELLTAFFHDKKMSVLADTFANKKDPVDDHEFIEILSRPVFEDDEEIELKKAARAEKSFVNKNQPPTVAGFPTENADHEIPVSDSQVKNDIQADVTDKDSLEPESEQVEPPLYSTFSPADDDEEGIEQEADDEQDTDEQKDVNGNLKNAAHTNDNDEDDARTGNMGEPDDEDTDSDPEYFTRKITDEDEDEDNDPDSSPLYARFQQSSEDEDDELQGHETYEQEAQDFETDLDDTEEEDIQPHPLEAGLRSVSQSDEDGDDEDDFDSEKNDAGNEEDDDDDDAYIPLWQHLSTEKDEEIEDETSNNSDNRSKESEGYTAIPSDEAVEQSRRSAIEEQEADESDEMTQKLISYLKPEKKIYVKEIFNNDEVAYIRALTRLSEFRTWREAGKFLTNDIFRKNGIDMYKDITVDFTDRLHKFFTDHMRR